jgi:hypothetical protein
MNDQLTERLERAKREVLADVAAGIVPLTVGSFSELHDYVDANGYGGAFEDDAPDTDDEIWDAMQDAVDGWIKSGAMAHESRGGCDGHFTEKDVRAERGCPTDSPKSKDTA